MNGQVLLRQAQIRWFPKIGRDWDLQIALEDPQPSITQYCDETDPDTLGCPLEEKEIAAGVSDIPDLVFSIRRNWNDTYHIKLASVVRELRATTDSFTNPGESITDKTYGWGITASGVIKFPMFNKNDKIRFQATTGEGIGRYTNDLNTLGGLDGVFDENDKIFTLPALAGFGAFEHWWTEQMRSTFLYSYVRIDNYERQPSNSYKKTDRLSVNYFWSPMPRFDVGAEILWGQRTNKDEQKGKATQFQFMTKYRF